MAVATYERQADTVHPRTSGAAAGNVFIYLASGILILSSLVKVLQPQKALDYMGSMGYTDGTYFLIAGLEFASAVLFLLRRTRRLGLVLVSAYFGGAMSAHLATHPPVTDGPGLYFLTTHPYVAVLVPGAFLVSAWIGAWRSGEVFVIRA